MMRVAHVSVLCFALAGLLGVGCRGPTEKMAQTQTTYGVPVDATEALPAPAVAAEDSLYLGRALTVDGRITEVGADGCRLRLDTGDEPPLLITAARTDAGNCAWQVPENAQGFAVAAGTLQIAEDTLRLTVNGVRMTPVRIPSPDS